MLKRIALTFISIAFIGGALVLYQGYQAYQYLNSPIDPSRESEILEVHPGSTFFQISRTLQERAWITQPRNFYWLAKYEEKLNEIKVGEYLLEGKMTPIELLNTITSGVSVSQKITIPEGYNLFQIADILENAQILPKEDFIQTARSKSIAEKLSIPSQYGVEGYLFPNTYFFMKNTPAEKVITAMVAEFHKSWNPSWDSELKKYNLSPHQAVILASIVEKETGAPWERPLISSVFHNRLRKRIPLGTDPTIIYGLILDGTYDGNIKRSHLVQKHPYNSRRNRGLPPTPIANPGRDSLEAAVHPKSTDYLYFVSKNDGTHFFSKTYAEHNKAVTTFQKNPKARSGKSWRDLNPNQPHTP